MNLLGLLPSAALGASAFSAILLALPLGCASAADLLVPEQYATIQSAVDAANDGDCVLLAAGMYPEDVSVLNRSVAIRSRSGAEVTVVRSITWVDETPVLRECEVVGITFLEGSELRANGLAGVRKCVFLDGAGVYFDPHTQQGAYTELADCEFRGATSIRPRPPGDAHSIISIRSCSFRGQGSVHLGLLESDLVEVTNCRFESVVLYSSGAFVSFSDCVFERMYVGLNSYLGVNVTDSMYVDCQIDLGTRNRFPVEFTRNWCISSEVRVGEGDPPGILDISLNRFLDTPCTVLSWSTVSLADNQFRGASPLVILPVEYAAITGNTFETGDATPLTISSCGDTSCIFDVTGNTLVGGEFGLIASGVLPTIHVTCNDFFDQSNSPTSGLPDPTGSEGNLSADPLFCADNGVDLALESESPCAPGNHPDGMDCGVIGGLEIGCGGSGRRPDLEAVTLGINDPYSLDSLAIRVVVRNRGEIPIWGWELEFTDGVDVIRKAGVPLLPHSSWTWVVKTVPVGTPHPATGLGVCLDPDNLFVESDESNNCWVGAETVADVESDVADRSKLWDEWLPRSPIRNGQVVELPPGCLEVVVIDAVGRVQRRATGGGGASTMNSFVWEASSDHGDRFAAGVYFLRLRGSGREVTKRVVFLRGQ